MNSSKYLVQRVQSVVSNCQTITHNSPMDSTNKLHCSKALQFSILSECSVSKARTSLMKLPHYEVELPMFMPVGTQGTMKGLTPEQVKEAGAQIILGNTYHLGTRPGKDTLDKYDGLHDFMQWDRALLTDSGGFQMVSLLKLSKITEEGVKFQSPYDGSECMLTPEESIHIQNSIGADIMMQLDDVVDVRETNYERFEVAVDRTTRWFDRCVTANRNGDTQNLFPIVQGGLFPDLRKRSLQQLIERDAPGYAIGGLSGGEEKNKFWPTVNLCTDHLPRNKPRYCMGVGFPVDVVVCCALGVDMFDCVYPTRTARFGSALVNGKQINLKHSKYKFDFSPIDESCNCSTCKNYTKAYLKTIVTKETVACHLISIHNIVYMMGLVRDIRESIKEGRFPEFVKEFMQRCFGGNYPEWVIDALKSVNICLSQGEVDLRKKQGEVDAADWDEEEEETKYLERVSGFRYSRFTNGYRWAVLDDYEEEAERGRLLGYKSGMTAAPKDQELPGTATPEGTVVSPLNPSRQLSEAIGVLSGCQALRKNDLNTEGEEEIRCLISKMEDLLSRTYSLSDETVSALCSQMQERTLGASQDLVCERQVVEYEKSMQCIKETKNLCDRLNWTSHLDQ